MSELPLPLLFLTPGSIMIVGSIIALIAVLKLVMYIIAYFKKKSADKQKASLNSQAKKPT